MNELQISTRYIDGVVILDLEGSILIGETSDRLRKILAALAFEDKKRVLINLAKVGTVDSTGLGSIVGGYTHLGKQGGQLKVENLSARNLELMHITKLYTVVEIFDHEANALESFQHPYRLTPLASSARIRSSLETDRRVL
jgi:anti-sigma B factor antagonist